MPRASALIPVCNGEKYIAEAIDSMLGQSFKDIEVIVIDDGSTDNTPAILDRYGDSIRRVAHPVGRGQAAALNTGRTLVTGEYVALLDSDDISIPERVATQVEYLARSPEVALVYSDRMIIDSEGAPVELARATAPDSFRLLQRNYIPRSSVLVRTSCLNETGPFDEVNTGNDDWDMWVRVSERHTLGYIPSPLIKYRLHESNISRTRRRPLDYYRKTRMRMLEGAYRRRGRPRWLGVMVLRARIEWLAGRPALYGERFPRVWSRSGRILDLLEMWTLSRFASVR